VPATNPASVYLWTAFLCALAGAIYDWRSRRIPNALTGPAALFGLALHLAVGGWLSMSTALLAGMLAGGVFLLFYLSGGMGAGDVKLAAAVSCCAGLRHVGEILIMTAIAGGVMAIVLALVSRTLRRTMSNVGALLSHHASAGITAHPNLNVGNAKTLRLPYGIAIGAGTAVTLLGALQGR